MSGRGWDRRKDGPPPEPSAAQLVCWRLGLTGRAERTPGPICEFTAWASVSEALQASEALSPCDVHGFCTGDHAVVYTDERGRIRCRRVPKPKQRKEKPNRGR